MDNLNVLTDAVLAGIAFVILMVIRQQVHSKIVARVPVSSKRRPRRHDVIR
jgi:hypothetical protein